MFVSLAVTSASSAPALAATPVTVTFSTPGEQGFVIPAGVRSIDVVAIGPTTVAEARRLGLVVAAVASSPHPAAVADAVTQAIQIPQETR